MLDFYEIDFLDIGAEKSGDAIPLRYSTAGATRIHVTDAGFQDTGTRVVDHVKEYYDSPSSIDAVIVTHPDGDHTGGLPTVLENFHVAELWMLRPWLYADELIHHFKRWSNADSLRRKLREVYPTIAELEEVAIAQGVPIFAPFQGSQIGAFTVLAPSKTRYLDLVASSEKTPEAIAEEMGRLLRKIVVFVRAQWGEETFSAEETSAENEMSVIQYANLCGDIVLLTGDAGRGALAEATSYARAAALGLPGIDKFQVPHHGSRRNVSSALLDDLLGEVLPYQLPEGGERFAAIVSASKGDEDHPRRSVLRACIHRGGKVHSTEGGTICTGRNNPQRAGWAAAPKLPYPQEQEED